VLARGPSPFKYLDAVKNESIRANTLRLRKTFMFVALFLGVMTLTDADDTGSKFHCCPLFRDI